jgi:hypothetical protein
VRRPSYVHCWSYKGTYVACLLDLFINLWYPCDMTKLRLDITRLSTRTLMILH